MTIATASLSANERLPAKTTACSWQTGWRSILLRAYDDPAQVEEFTTAATPDHLIVLVTGGSCQIEARYRGAWYKTDHRTGSVAMTAPGEEVTLRWRGATTHQTLQLHIPEHTIRAAYDDFSDRGMRPGAMPNAIGFDDPLIGYSMYSLYHAMSEGFPDLYAESAVHFLTVHLLSRHAGGIALSGLPSKKEDARIKRAEEFLRANIAGPLTLEDVASVAGISRFHLVRLFKDTYNETPFRHLTRLRIEEAKSRLLLSHQSVTEIALECGYENSAHFASAFRRWVGMSPRQYREHRRRV